MESNYLVHYGVKGMKWGVRKDRYDDPDRFGIKAAKAERKKARKEYSKAYDKAYNFSEKHLVSQYIPKSKNYKKSNDLWEDAFDKARKTQQASNKVKVAKQAYKKEYAKNYKKIQENILLGEKLLYNDATSQKAAKLATKYNIPLSEAYKKTKKEANRNTAIILAGIGAYTLAKTLK